MRPPCKFSDSYTLWTIKEFTGIWKGEQRCKDHSNRDDKDRNQSSNAMLQHCGLNFHF